MHWTYKIASILAVALITLAAGFYAQNNEETYPSGPSYDIGISDAHGQPLSTLTVSQRPIMSYSRESPMSRTVTVPTDA